MKIFFGPPTMPVATTMPAGAGAGAGLGVAVMVGS
jgi:hypothetical protein